MLAAELRDAAKQLPGSGAIRRVLVVDDSRMQRRILVALLKRWGYDVAEAENGQQALDLCAADPPELILSDWMMPGMSGLDLCAALRSLPHDNYSYFILLTSKSESSEVTRGLDAGADDFLTKPVNADELRARINAGERILAMQRQLSDKNRLITETLGRLQDAYDVIDCDLIQARKIQQALVPEFQRDFGRSRVSLFLKPCGHIGGDLVGMFTPGDTRIGFYAIDVSGHGITSAMMTARLGSYLSGRYPDQNIGMEQRFNAFYALRQPCEVAELLNARLLADTGNEEYFTMVYGIADLRSGKVRLVQAGHPPPLLIPADGPIRQIGQGGLPVGLLPKAKWDQMEFIMQPGDRLLLYSDGFTEATMRNGAMLEEDGLAAMIADLSSDLSGREFLDDLFWRMTEAMMPDMGLDDDVSATLFEFKGV